MAAGAVLLVAAVLVLHGARSSIPPKFVKASYGVQKALYARNYGYSLVPIPARILVQAHPPKTLPIVGDVPVLSSRQGRAYKYYRPRSSSRRRRKRPPPKRIRRPSAYGVPVYATKYKNYVPSRRPPSKYIRYKKKRRPFRVPPKRPPPYREVHHDFDEYEQEISDDYEEYDSRDHDYSYVDIPSKRLPLEYDKEFLNRHADLYNGGYNPGIPRGRPKDVHGQYTEQVRTRVRYQTNKEDHYEQPEKASEDSQEAVWPGEVTSVHAQETPWHDQSQSQDTWHDSSGTQTQVHQWQEDSHHQWHDQLRPQAQLSSDEWHNHPRPPRQDNQWQVYQTIQQQQSHQPQAHQSWSFRPTRSPDVRGWTTSLRPKPLSAAVAVPSRPVVPREPDPANHRPVYNWDPASNSYQIVERETRPKYQAHYSEADFNYHNYRGGQEAADRKSTEGHRSVRAFSEPDIGFGEGMEVVDDGVAGWKVKK